MKKLIHTLAGILLLTAPMAAFADNDRPLVRSISVTGEAKEDVAPDQAILSVSLVSRDKDLNTAKNHNDKLADKLVVIAKEHNVPKEKIALSNLYISPEYDYSNNAQTFRGYMVSRSMRVTVDEVGKEELLLGKLVAAKVDQVNGIEFALADPEARAMKLRVKAFENAKAKALALTQAAGVKLGAPITISTNGLRSISQPGVMPMMAMARAEKVMDSSGPSTPGQVTLQENVQVVFGLE
jgi:uncharacterized protein